MFEINRLIRKQSCVYICLYLQALDALNKKDITEVRSYGRPPGKVELVMEAVMILKQVEPTWAEAKRQLGDVNFLNQVITLATDSSWCKSVQFLNINI